MKQFRFVQIAALVAALGVSPLARADSPMLGGPRPTQSMNPDLSLDGLFGLTQFNKDEPLVFEGGHDPKQNGFNIQQVEIALTSTVDPYFWAFATFLFVSEPGGRVGTELEEAYATSLSLPWNLQTKVGQYLTSFGRNNPVHPEKWDFVNRPLVVGRFLGGDGLRGPGAQLSWLSPLPWYSEFMASGQNSVGETMRSFRPLETSRQRSMNDLLYVFRWANFFTVHENLLLNLGASFANGPAEFVAGDLSRTRILGADLFLKFRETSALSFISLQAEWMRRYLSEDRSDWGFYTELNYRLPAPLQGWHTGVRFDKVGPNALPGAGADFGPRWRVSPVLTYYPSEFSKIRLQYDYDKPADFNNAQQVVTLQFEFGIGAHPAHTF